jgi:4-alpha-glucanotransferase
MVPLFSLRSARSWGIGEFLDLPVFAKWLHAARQSFVQILPITEVPSAQRSPYSAMTAMALDPIYISLDAVEELSAGDGYDGVPATDREALESLRRAPRVRYAEIRQLKDRALRRAFERFQVVELAPGTERATNYLNFIREHAAWLDDFALFQALRLRFSLQPWWEWPKPLANRDEPALRDARHELRAEIEYRKYLQWIAALQWTAARRTALPLQVFGDVPFMISADSPDVWTRQAEFRFDATVGVPPDAFSETGQDWGLPPWRWEVMAANDFEWMRQRAARTSQLFDGFRLDHLVGLYRTFIRPIDKAAAPFFAPADEATQLRLGETLVGIYQAGGAEVIAEDLGTVPAFVRRSLLRRRVPGFKVMRWERRWTQPHRPYIDPAEYVDISVATSGTHDTEPLVCWWETLDEYERAEILRLRSVRRALADGASPNEAMLRAMLNARSQLAIVPIQDVFGWTDRINTPAQVNEENWTWLLPWPVDQLLDVPEARQRAELLARWTRESGRDQGSTGKTSDTPLV